jgi:phosphoglycolate phosphatase
MIHQQFLRLILFDIDGTLISTDGIAKRTFAEVMNAEFGPSTAASDYDFSGKTDQVIYSDIAALMSIDPALAEQKQDEVFDRFFTLLEQRLHQGNVTVLPGVHILLDALEQEEAATSALLTGNMLRGARIKLTPPDLLRYFSFGAFGSDALHRHELPAIAQTRAYDKLGVVFKAKEIVVIGDTPHDIDCGRHLNVKTIAVATGRYSHDQLAAEKPDFLFDNLSETDRILDAIFS